MEELLLKLGCDSCLLSAADSLGSQNKPELPSLDARASSTTRIQRVGLRFPTVLTSMPTQTWEKVPARRRGSWKPLKTFHLLNLSLISLAVGRPILWKYFIYLFLEIGEGREKEERNIFVRQIYWLPLTRTPTGNPACKQGLCPDWESNWRPFNSQAGPQSTELPQPGLEEDPVLIKGLPLHTCATLSLTFFKYWLPHL